MATATVSPVAAHHYIRSIHTSFTSAHHAHAHAHASRPHAAAVSAFGGGMLGQHHSLVHNHNHHQQQQQGGYHHPHHTYNNGQGLHSGSSPHQAQNISISTHNAHMYAHHLRDLTVSSTPVTAATSNSQMRQVASQGPPLHHRPSRHQLHSQRQQQQQNYHTSTNGGQGQGQAKEQGVAGLAGPVFTPPPLAGAKRALSPVYQQQQEQQYPMTRKRSSSIRGSVSPLTMTTPTTGMAAAATRKDQRGRSGSYRFDPFADEDVDIGVGENERAKPIESISAPASYPYTIQIPAAGPSEIERYTGAGAVSAPIPRATTTTTIGSRPLSPRAAEFTPTRSPSPPKSASSGLRSAQPPYSRSQPQSPLSVTQFRSTTPTQATETSTPTLTLTPKSIPAPRPTPKSTSMPTPNLSKIVAGILLNRVHAVGKPMRRRIVYADPCVSVRYTNANAAAGLAEGAGARAGMGAGRGYVKSCLSRVVSVEC